MTHISKITTNETVSRLMKDNNLSLKDIMTDDDIQNLHHKKILTGSELLLLPEMANNYIVENLIWEDDVVVVMAREKVGKSVFSLQLACALTGGTSFLGEYDVIRPLRVLYIQAEGSKRNTVDWIKRMTVPKLGVKWNPDNYYHYAPPALALDTDHEYDGLLELLSKESFRPEVILIDPLYMAMQGKLTDDQSSRQFCRNIRRLQAEFKCTIVIIHHENRGVKDQYGNKVEQGDDSIYGSFVWKAFPSHIVRLTKLKDGTRRLSCVTQRNGNIEKGMELTMIEPYPLKFEKKEGGQHQKSTDSVYSYIQIHGKIDGVDRTEIMQALALGKSTVNKALAHLIDQDVDMIYKVNPGRYPIKYKSRVQA